MTTKHTPTPYIYERDDDFFNDSNGTAYIDINGPVDSKTSRFARIDAGPTAKDDAEFIVRACNCHDELLAAARFAVNLADHYCCDFGEQFAPKSTCECNYHAAYRAARAAIAKAEKGTP
jgi:hypothetical protein